MLTFVWSEGLVSDVWHASGLVSRAFYIVLVVTTFYCLSSEARVMIRLRSLRKLNPTGNLGFMELLGTRDLIENVQQAIRATFYLFGFVLFSNLQQIGNFVDHTKASPDWRIFQNFVFHCFLAQTIFFVLLFLHVSQWFVSGRLNACARRLDAGQLNQVTGRSAF